MSVEKADFKTAAANGGNFVIVGKNKILKVGDHGFSKYQSFPMIFHSTQYWKTITEKISKMPSVIRILLGNGTVEKCL